MEKLDIPASGALSAQADAVDLCAEDPNLPTEHEQDSGKSRERPTKAGPRRSPIKKRSNKKRREDDDDDQTTDQGDQRITRSQWPEDRDKKLAILAKIMPQALADYFGDEAIIAYRLSVWPDEVREIIESDEELQRLQALHLSFEMPALEARMMHHALNAPNGTYTKLMLERRYPGKWARETGKKTPVRSYDLPEGSKAALSSVLEPTDKGN